MIRTEGLKMAAVAQINCVMVRVRKNRYYFLWRMGTSYRLAAKTRFAYRNGMMGSVWLGSMRYPSAVKPAVAEIPFRFV
jgi:hypothetical protein